MGFIAGLGRAAIDREPVRRALQSLQHRGPDGTGEWYAKNRHWFLGHARLSIIGLENGGQPISSSDGHTHIVVNGEFYGYKTIRAQLLADGARFATDSDSEILLHLYERHGVLAARQLRGEFACVIADQRHNAMIAIRDRFGIKPLFYTVHNGAVLFASEIKALLALGAPAAWDGEAFAQESFMIRPQERTLFAGIYSVPAGCYAIAQGSQVSIYPYWDWNFPLAETLARDQRSDAELVREFKQVLDDAVRERLVADVEVASYLSGGIDSCAVLGLAQKHSWRPIRAFTLAFEDHQMYDESPIAEAQAKFVGANYCRVPVKSPDLAAAYGDAVWHAETIFVNGHASAKFLLSRAVRDAGIKVVFTGEGSDELFGGYIPFRRDMVLHHSHGTDAEKQRLMQRLFDTNPASRAIFINENPLPPECAAIEQRLGWRPSWMDTYAQPGVLSRTLFRDEFAHGPGSRNPYALALDRVPIASQVFGRDRLNQALYLNAKFQLPNFILTFLGDRMEMAHSIEGRVPFLNHHVAEFTALLPLHMKINGLREKHILREATKDCLIEAVYNREKHPFVAPPAQRHSDPLLQFFGDVVNSKACDAQPIYDPVKVRGLFELWRETPPDRRIALESLLHRAVSTTVLHDRFGMSSSIG